MRNHFNLVRLLGLIITGIGAFLAITSGIILKYQLQHHVTNNLNILGLFFIFSSLHFILGVCLLLKLRWTQKVSIIFFIGAIIFGTFFLMNVILPQCYQEEEYYTAIAISIPCYTFYFCGIIYLRTAQIQEAYSTENIDFGRKEDILDQF